MSGYLTTVRGENLPVRDGFVIGRVAGCDLVIQDGKASRRHARIVVAGGVAEVEDLQSSNGTRLNDKPVTRRVLRDGDRIEIGATVLVYREGTAPGAAPSAAAKPAAFVDEDDDLLGGDAPAVAPAASPAASPAAAPAAAQIVVDEDDDDVFADRTVAPPSPPPTPAPPRPATPSAPPKPAAPPASVVEFADEIVEVRKPAPAPAAKSPAAASQGGATTTASGRILQYNKQAGAAGGPLADDFGQLAGGTRWVALLLILALGAGIVWGTVAMVR